MQLEVQGLQNAPFKHLWGRYVLGFRPWTHCLRCLETKAETIIKPGMTDGVYRLRDDQALFYLCGVGQANSKKAGKALEQRFTNVHLAVHPRPGSVAAIGSVYGASFLIRDAEAIPIQPLRAEDFPHLPEKHVRCKNFQFGYQTFAASLVGDQATSDVIRNRRE